MLIRSISGLRGTVGIDDSGLTAEVLSRYVSAFASYVGNAGSIAIGYDGRRGGEHFYQLAVHAAILSGCDALALGMVPTPTVQMATEHVDGVRGGIAITASHNPAEWNGMKFIAPTGMFLDAEENRDFWKIVDGPPLPSAKVDNFGRILKGDNVVTDHLERIANLKYIDRDAIGKRKFKVVLDAVNASGSEVHPKLLAMLGVTDVVRIACDSSGVFPHPPEPVPANLVALGEAVVHEKADFGIAVDPDADRLVLLMENGEPFSEENTIVLAAEHVLKLSGSGAKIVVNLSTTRSLEDLAATYGAEVVRTPVGEINVAKRMKQLSSIIGGEGSGGVILPEVHLGRDSLVGVALAVAALAQFEGTISEKKAALPQYEIVKSKIELRSQEQVAEILSKLRTLFSDRAKNINADDGIRIDFEKSWLHARSSNTEPIIRLIAEAPSREEAQRIIDEAFAAI